jgi:uncharacterized membrane protein YphA (DoxX/SURF4 family)
MDQLIDRSVAPLGSSSSPKALRIASWVVRVAAALMFVMAGSAKLRGAPEMVGLFTAIGIGQWFRYLTGTLEVAGALLLVVPRLAGVGAVLLACVMLGALATHLFVIGGNPALPITLLAAVVFVAWTERDRLAALVRAGR